MKYDCYLCEHLLISDDVFLCELVFDEKRGKYMPCSRVKSTESCRFKMDEHQKNECLTTQSKLLEN